MNRSAMIGTITLISLAAVAVWIMREKLKTMFDKSAWIWPVDGYKNISSPFGTRTHPVTGAQGSFHNGIDIPAPTGTFVLAPQSGTVKSVYFNSTGGNQLIIEHDNGYTTGYAHLSLVLVDPGERVERGEPIAKVGNTGASTGSHLHYTVKNKNANDELTYVDPKSLYA